MLKDLVSFIMQQFDKILLTLIFACLVTVVLHMSHDAMDKDIVSWAKESAGTILGALLTIVTGGMLRSRKED